MKDGKCVALNDKISNCRYQQDETSCFLCISGYVLSLDKQSCVEANATSLCLFSSLVECKECKKEYVFNRNYYLDYLMDFGVNNSQKFENQVNKALQGHSQGNLPAPCQPVSITNCLTASNFDSCSECSAGHFLTGENKCEKNPESVIPGCEIYTSTTTCSQCLQGFYLKSSSECKAVVPIDSCLDYKPSADATVCELCMNTHYLKSASNRCELRIISPGISNCSQLNKVADNCLECLPNFQITDDKRKCLSVISSCFDYHDSTLNSSELTCKTCEEGFFLSGTTCDAGGVSDCKTYNVNSDVCVLCNAGFYVSNQNTCEPHNPMELCKTYSANQAHRCTQCEAGHFLFDQIRGCELITNPLPKCLAYTNATTCSACEEGYALAPGTCVLIPLSENCLTKVDNICTKCKPNYYLDSQ